MMLSRVECIQINMHTHTLANTYTHTMVNTYTHIYTGKYIPIHTYTPTYYISRYKYLPFMSFKYPEELLLSMVKELDYTLLSASQQQLTILSKLASIS